MVIFSVIENWNDVEIFNAEILLAFMFCTASIFLTTHPIGRKRKGEKYKISSVEILNGLGFLSLE